MTRRRTDQHKTGKERRWYTVNRGEMRAAPPPPPSCLVVALRLPGTRPHRTAPHRGLSVSNTRRRLRRRRYASSFSSSRLLQLFKFPLLTLHKSRSNSHFLIGLQQQHSSSSSRRSLNPAPKSPNERRETGTGSLL